MKTQAKTTAKAKRKPATVDGSTERLRENMDVLSLAKVATFTGIDYSKLRTAAIYGNKKEVLSAEETGRLNKFLSQRGKSMIG